jgi:AraC-like DNA-binding protein
MQEAANRAALHSPYCCFDVRNVCGVIHYHEELELVYIQSGSVIITGEQGEFILQSGDLCFFLPLEIHNITTPEHSLCWIIKFLPQGGYDGEFLKNVRSESNVISASDADYNASVTLLHTVKTERENGGIGSHLSVILALGQLQLLLLRKRKLIPLTTTNRRKLLHHYTLLDSVNHLLENTYQDTVCLESAAQALGFSKFYFAHKFKDLTGMTFIEYLTRFRLEKAKELLVSQQLSITEAAMQCGFGSLRNFNRAFRQFFDCTPTEYLRSLPQTIF